MSSQLSSAKGGPLRLGSELARGGEGIVHDVAGHPDFVAKIYHSPPDRNKAEKLIAMANDCTDRLRKISAWPIDTIHDGPGGRVRGFVMRRVSRQKDIHVLYGPKTRLRDYPDATYRFLVHVAANVARAFAVVHEHGHVIGDVNQGGVCVSPQGTVTLVDCDSFQVSADRHLFGCDVGIPIYQPPELQTVSSFHGLQRSPNHDAFGLAVLIFQTLFLARHPFAGAFQGNGDMTIERAIREFRFAYGRDAVRRQMKQPPGSLGLSAVSPAVAELFERAFLEGGVRNSRPTALEWVAVLDALSAELRDCSQNPAHAYSRALSTCPLCELEGHVGVLLFLPPRQAAVATPMINLDELWNEFVPIIAAARIPSASQIGVPALPPPDSVVRFKRAKSRAKAVMWTGISLSLLLAVMLHPAAIAGVIVFPAIAVKLIGPVPDESRKPRERLTAAEERFSAIVRQIERERTMSPLPGLEARAETLYRGLKNFAQRSAERLRNLERSRHERQMRRFLDHFEVKDCRVKGLGPGLVAALISHAVETADDLTSAKLEGIAGFGPKRITALLDWRRNLEAQFRFNASDPADAQERVRVERELQIEYAKELAELRQLTEQVKTLAPSLRTRLAALSGELGRAQQELAIARATAAALGKAA